MPVGHKCEVPRFGEVDARSKLTKIAGFFGEAPRRWSRGKSYNSAPRLRKMGNTRSPWHYYEPRGLA
jgi:hypothetical protein